MTVAILTLLVIFLGIALYFTVRRLLQFDTFVATVGESIVKYEAFVRGKISHGVLEAHPEIQEFHQNTMLLLKQMETVRKEIFGSPKARRKKSTAAVMSEEPGT